MANIIRFVVGTRHAKEDFLTQTALGRSLALYNFPFVEICLFPNNQAGLPKIYNQAIEAAKSAPAVLVFSHDDVHLCDYYWVNEMMAALTNFQLVGLAGNKRRLPRQPSWLHANTAWEHDAIENLSGIVGHGKGFPPENLCIYGTPCQEVKLLDGMLLFAHSQTLIEHAIRFDEQFDFHFYDADICRTVEQKGLKMGTWRISAVHESFGHYNKDHWASAYEAYLRKWGQ